MLEYISIKAFRGLHEFDADFGAVTALLGPNSSGKTTVLHAIRIACDQLRFALEAPGTCKKKTVDGRALISVADGLVISDSRSVAPLSDWQALFTDQVTGEGVSASLDLRFSPDHEIRQLGVRLICGRNQQLKLDVLVDAPDVVELIEGLPVRSPRINAILSEALSGHAPRAVLVPPFYGTVPDEEYRARIVIDRLLGTGDQSHVVRNLIADLDPDRFNRLNAFLADTLGARLEYRTFGDLLQTESPLRVTFKDSNGEIEISAAGAGLVNLIALYASLARWRQEASERPVIFLLDEPEAHLAPRLQAESAARLGRLVRDEFGAQLLLATHSVDILNRLSQEGALLLRCDRTASPSATSLRGDADLFADLATWTDLTPYTAINFLASRRILFGEGKTDVSLIPRLARLLFRDRPDKRAAFERWAIVELTGTGNRPVTDLLARLLRSEAVRLNADATTFKVGVVLDRDYARDRTPGVTTGPDTSVTTTVWTRHSIESLFIDIGILVTWIRAFVAPDIIIENLSGLVADAIDAADRDASLNNDAQNSIAAAAIADKIHGGERVTRNENRLMRDAMAEAARLVEESPAVWQRGKDRASFVLRYIRERLPPAARGHFPTSLEVLIERADSDCIGEPARAVPGEVRALIERIAT